MIIDAKSPVPIFQQIARQLRQRISAGIYKPNESLPSLRSLAAEIQVNPNTVQKAYDELAREGLIESRRGSGLFVIEPDDAKAASTKEKQFSRDLSSAIEKALSKGVSPQRIRTIFRELLDQHVVARFGGSHDG